MKKTLLLLLLTLCGTWAVAQEKIDYSVYDDKCNFYIANDLGRNGYYDQKSIAELMGTMAEEVGPECVIAAGDIHHFDGVASVNDPLWMTNYEQIYSHPELMIAWHPICGNHEYRGNTQGLTRPRSSTNTVRNTTSIPTPASKTSTRNWNGWKLPWQQPKKIG